MLNSALPLERVINDFQEFGSIADVLEADFKLRSSEDSNFSIRHYGRVLAVDPSTLSQAMRKKRRLTSKQIQSIGRLLGARETEIGYLIDREIDVSGFIELPETAAFFEIDHWHYDALLELLDGESVENDLTSLARSLRIDKPTLEQLKRHLQDADLLRSVDGRWQDTVKHSTSIANPGDSQLAAREYQKSLAHESLITLETVQPALRNHTSVLLQISEEDLPLIKAVLKTARRTIATDYQNGPREQRKLYALQMSLFPLSTASPLPELHS